MIKNDGLFFKFYKCSQFSLILQGHDFLTDRDITCPRIKFTYFHSWHDSRHKSGFSNIKSQVHNILVC